MNDNDLSKEQLVEELARLRQCVAELERAEHERQHIEETLSASEERYPIVSDMVSDFAYAVRVEPDGSVVPEWQTTARKHREFLENLPQIVYEIDSSGRFTYMNPSGLEAFGYSAADLAAGIRTTNLLVPASRQQAEDNVRRLMQGERLIVTEHLARRKDGTTFPVIAYSSAMIWDGQVAGIQGVCVDITERKQVEEVLRESEVRYRTLFKGITDALFVQHVGADGSAGRFLEVNDVACQRLGYTREELLAMSLQDVDAPESGVDVVSIVRELVAGRDVTFEQTHVARDGRRIPVEVHARAITLDGHPGVLSIARDITDRKKAEEALRESEAKYRSIYEDSPFAIELYDAAGILVDVNPACLDLFGVTNQRELRGFDLFADPNLAGEHKEQLRNGKTVHYQVAFDFEQVRALNLYHTSRVGIIWLDVLITPLTEPLAGYLVQVQDITERKRAEETLQDQRWRLESIVEGTYVGTWEWNVQSGETTFNETWAQILGYTLDELAPTSIKTWEALAHPDDLTGSGKLLERHFAGELPYYDCECRMKHKDGRWVWVHDRGRLVTRTADGKPLMMFGTHTDITERKRAEQALHRSNADLQHFAYAVSHDLQEPLRMVSSYVQLLAQRYAGRLDPDADEFMGYAVEGAQRMSAMIYGILDYSRVDSQGQAMAPTDCEALLQRALSVHQLVIEDSSAVVTHDPLPTVQADATQLGRVFQNLLSNALKFRGEAPPKVHVSARQTDGVWVFSVQDNGIGIDPQYAGQLFQVFRRLHSRAEYPGTGIGLALCKRIVERHGGRIWVDSQPGEGATFYFTLPVQGE